MVYFVLHWRLGKVALVAVVLSTVYIIREPPSSQVNFWSTVLIAYHYIVLRDDGGEPSDGKDNRPV